jgi:hypothetical protein
VTTAPLTLALLATALQATATVTTARDWRLEWLGSGP